MALRLREAHGTEGATAFCDRGGTAPPARGAFTPTLTEPCAHANDVGCEMHDAAGGKALRSSSLPTRLVSLTVPEL